MRRTDRRMGTTLNAVPLRRATEQVYHPAVSRRCLAVGYCMVHCAALHGLPQNSLATIATAPTQ